MMCNIRHSDMISVIVFKWVVTSHGCTLHECFYRFPRLGCH